MTTRCVLMLVALLAPTLCAHAAPDLGPAPYAAPKSGAKFHWRDVDSARTLTALARASDGVVHRWSYDGRVRSTIPFCVDCTVEGMIYPFDEYRALWPLEVGNAVEFRRMRDGDAWRNRAEVSGTDSLQLEFGAVDVYLVEVESHGVTFDVSSWRKRSRIWYAPSLSSAVRIETEVEHGRLNERRVSRWELIGYEPP